MENNNKKGLIVFLISLIIILIIILVIVTIVFFCLKKDNKEPDLPSSPYNETALNAMKEYNVYNEINNKEYNETIEAMLEEKKFNSKYLNNYYEIEYLNTNNFTTNVNKLLDANYNSTEINYILKNYLNNIDIILSMDYIDILKYKDITNFDLTKIKRYEEYQKNKNYDLKTSVTYVNIGLDLKGYSKYSSYTLEEAKDITILVNKYHKLPDNYEPDDLTSLSYNRNYFLRKEAANAFEALTNAGVIENVYFYPFSPYRSFATQSALYTNYKNRDGESKADTYSARPGFSEHQTGLAVDVRSSTLPDNLTPAHYEWMLNNSYKYGFIVRYPKGKQYITQFIEEPWHLRYLGVELAAKVHDSGLTYDEYYDLYIEKR